VGKTVTVKGWLRTAREADKGQLLFVELTDGSCAKGLQLVLSKSGCVGMEAVCGCGGVGASIAVTGTVVRSPATATKQVIEVHGKSASVLGAVYNDDGTYKHAYAQTIHVIGKFSLASDNHPSPPTTSILLFPTHTHIPAHFLPLLSFTARALSLPLFLSLSRLDWRKELPPGKEKALA
jgi:hypothetical protein